MVALPLFKLGSLFLRHISKYGANRIKAQAHDHPRFRQIAASYGQWMHQWQMRFSVMSLRDIEAENRAKEKAEAPTVKTKEQLEKEERKAKQQGGKAAKPAPPPKPSSVWTRKFRPLPEAKAVDLFADVLGDTFILFIASALIVYETWRSSQKPDTNAEKIKEINKRLEELDRRENELEQAEEQHQSRILAMEAALRGFKDPKTKQPLLPPAPTSPPTASPAA